ncbi:MAG: MATE family efflux transporter [Sedimentisphaerales bacterium]|nr:MATE family efflux transporter [Sedimentisphaerales bacterium]
MITPLRHRWQGPGGAAEVLTLAFPLILNSSAHTIQMFVDSVFLARHSQAEMAAAVQAGLAMFAICSFFLGTVQYVNTFVAQYTGANRHQRVGPAVWQGIFFSLASGLLILGLIPTAEPFFRWVGHDPVHRQNEIIYFRIICFSAAPMLLSSSVAGFFTGRSKMWIVMAVNCGGTIVNLVLDYCWIYGHWIFPEWGIAGAAWATVASHCFTAAVFFALFLRAKYRRPFATLSGRRLSGDLLGRLLRFGAPNGVQFMLDMLAFNLFLILIGRMDKHALEATTIAFRINLLAFLPMIGLGIAVTTLVGQALGRNQPGLAQRTTWSAFCLTISYMSLVALGYWIVPDLFLLPFAGQNPPEDFTRLAGIVTNLLRFIGFYCLFDTGNIIFAAALKGAGDTRFVMLVAVVLSWLIMVLPTFLAVRFGWGLYAAWSFATVYVCVLSLVYLSRFLHGKWKSMRVIEIHPLAATSTPPAMPTTEADTP